MQTGALILSDFSRLAIKAAYKRTGEDSCLVMIADYEMELELRRDLSGKWEYHSPFRACNPRWLGEIAGQIDPKS